MKVLMINKFLYPNGGSETYMFELGKQLERMGHEVQYFGMEHEGRCVGNRVDAYTGSMDFHGGSKLAKLTYPLKTIYSSEARQKLRLVLDDFRPDVIHLNNFNYQLTPSILLEADKWRKESGHACSILYTAHDHQLVCPDGRIINRLCSIQHHASHADRKMQARVPRYICFIDFLFRVFQTFFKLVPADFRHEKQKFITAIADQGILIPYAAPDYHHQCFQHRVTGIMTTGIVVKLEIIQVDHGYAALLHRGLDLILIITAVVGTSQCINI